MVFIKKVLSSLTLLCASFLFSQTVTSTFDDFTIADCVSTPCQDIIVEGGLDGLSFKYIDCNCNTTGVYIPKGKVYVLKALVGKIEVAQGAFNPTGVISQPVSNTLYVEALEELIQTSFGSINNSIDPTQQNLCIGEQPATITGYEGQFFDFDIFYSWLKSTDNINFSYIRGARSKDYTPEVLNETTYFKRQVFTAVSTGTYSEVVKVAVSSCDDNCVISPTYSQGSLSQTVTESTSIATTTVAFTLSCSETINILASGLPLGIQTEVTSNSITLFGTPSELATGLFNFSLVASSTSASTSYTVTGTIEVIEGPNVPTQVRPHLLPSIFISPFIEDNVGETFIGPFNATTSPTLKEGQKYYNIKHQQDEED